MSVAAAGAGIDTWKLCWRVPENVLDLDALGMRPTGRGVVAQEPVEGHRVGEYGAGLLWAEGHPSADGLCRPGALGAARDRVEAAVSSAVDLDLSTYREGVGRLDVAVDLAFEDGAAGMAVLAGMAGLNAGPHFRVVSHRAPGERAFATVAWHSSRGVQARAYDKGREALSAPVGRLLRAEDQRKWSGGSRRLVDELDARYVRETWARRFAPMSRASRGVVLVTQAKLVDRVREAVQSGEISAGQAVDVIGHLVAEANGFSPGSQPTRWRRRRLVDQLGLQLVDGVLQEVEINMAEVFEVANDPRTWADDDGS